MTSSPVERVHVSIDVVGLFRVCQDLFGREHRVNFQQLLTLVKKNPMCSLPRMLEVIAYTVDGMKEKLIVSVDITADHSGGAAWTMELER